MNERITTEATNLLLCGFKGLLAKHLSPEQLLALSPELYRISRAGVETAVLAHERLAHRLRPLADSHN